MLSVRLRLPTGLTVAIGVVRSGSTIATNSGDLTKPPACRLKPTTIAITNDTPNPSAVSLRIAPRRRCTSISSPERNSRKASPISARIETGSSGFTHPRTEGPMMIPSTISSMIAGSRIRGKKPRAKGASTPAATTINRLVKCGADMPKVRLAAQALRARRHDSARRR